MRRRQPGVDELTGTTGQLRSGAGINPVGDLAIELAAKDERAPGFDEL
jgi:hypothetical protein